MDKDEDYVLMFERHKRIVTYQVDQLTKLLNAIKPERSRFLFTDLIGRIVWNATATTNTIKNLAECNDDYGIASILRKLFECRILINYMFTTENRSEVIGRILANGYFDETENFSGSKLKEWRVDALDSVRRIVAGFNEDQKIIDYFVGFIGNKRKHWHWIEQGFANASRKFDDRGDSLFRSYSQMAHVNVLDDYLEPTEEIKYRSPLTSSTRRLAGLLGICRFINMDIIDTTAKHASTIGFDAKYFEDKE